MELGFWCSKQIKIACNSCCL